MSLVELSFTTVGWNAMLGQMIPELLRNHSTLKIFRLVMEVDVDSTTDFEDAIQMATESVRVCQLQSLELSIYPDLIGELDSESYPDAAGLVQAFTSNVTLTDVSISDNMARNMRMYDPKKIAYFTLRNKKFQEIMSSLSMVSEANSGNNSISTIPLGLWPCILQAAHKRFPDASMVYSIFSLLLSTQTVDLICGWEE
jgi:hypothetical protein